MSYNIGPKIGIDGEKEFRTSIKNINDNYKALEAETKAVTAAFDAQGDEQGKLEATSKQLQKQIDLQKEKMSLLEDAVAKATDKFGENSLEATRLRGALYDTKATVADLESELKNTHTQLDRTEDSMEAFEEATEDAGDEALNFGDILKADMLSDVILDGLRELVGLVKEFATGSIEAAAEVQAATAQFEQTFSGLESTAQSALDEIADDTGIASTRIQDSFTTIYAFAKNAGFGYAEALNIASRATSAAADNAAYYDKTVEEATEQLQAFIKGNYANDAALGLSCTETTRNAKANQLYAKSFSELAESQKVDVLLAMVEASNEASGALGQAARESDSWANVTGELSEVMRLLQAEVGKPALKKLVPVIQKITKAGYELIDDVDWDEFGETVANIADSVIEYGPGIVRTIATVAAGIVAFKATQKVGEFVSLAQSFIGIGTAAQTAGAAVATSGAVASASPWGLVALAIGGAVALVVAAATNAETAAESLNKAMDDLETSVKDANTRYEDTKVEVEGAASAAKYYVDRLEELETAGLDTAAAHKEYEMLVEELNELIPDLNLTIDEQTGLIDRNTEALRADIDAWKENATVKALQDKFSDVLEAQGKAEAEVAEGEAKLNRLKSEGTRLTDERKSVVDALETAEAELVKAENDLAAASIQGGDAMAEAAIRCGELENEIYNLTGERDKLDAAMISNRDEQRDLNSAVADAKEIVASYDDEVKLAEESLQLYTEQITENTDQQVLLTDAQLAVKESLYNLAMEFSEAKLAAEESINTQIGLFDELAAESDWSAEKIIQNWESQRLAFDNYSGNLLKAVDMGLDEVLVQQLSDGSTESMQILDALVNDTDIDIDQINASFAKTSESKEALATTMADVQTDFSDRMDEIVEDAETAGMEIPAGLADGVSGSAYKFINEVISMATEGITWFEDIFDINSPSRVMKKEAGHIVSGAAGGVDENADLFEKSMASLADLGYDAFLAERIDRAESYPDMVNTSTMSSSRTTNNYGGISFQIYQQPGESAEDLAYRIADILQTQVDAKRAVF